MIHEDCVELINQVGSYAYVKDDKGGKDKLPVLNDDLVVTVKYLLNTMGIRPVMWESEGSVDESKDIRGDEISEDEEWDMDRIFREGQNEINRLEGYQDDRASLIEGETGFFGIDDIFG